jgi:hypothetical protein
MTLLSKIDYTTNGTDASYSFTFEVISHSDVKVSIDEIDIPQADATYGWSLNSLTAPTQVVFDSAPAADKALRISRTTDKTSIYKTFTNGPLNATDLTKSFKKVLFIEQEAYDLLTESTTLFNNSGNLPQPRDGEEDDWLLITEGGIWVIRGATVVKDALGLGITDDVDFASFSVTDVSSVNFSGSNFEADHLKVKDYVEGPLVIKDDTSNYARIRSEGNKPLIIGSDNLIKLNVAGEERWRFTQQMLHNYKDDALPAGTDHTNTVIALSGTDAMVLAANTPKAWVSIEQPPATPTSVTLIKNYGVSAVLRAGVGDYYYDVSSGHLADDCMVFFQADYFTPYPTFAFITKDLSNNPPRIRVRTFTYNALGGATGTAADIAHSLMIY